MTKQTQQITEFRCLTICEHSKAKNIQCQPNARNLMDWIKFCARRLFHLFSRYLISQRFYSVHQTFLIYNVFIGTQRNLLSEFSVREESIVAVCAMEMKAKNSHFMSMFFTEHFDWNLLSRHNAPISRFMGFYFCSFAFIHRKLLSEHIKQPTHCRYQFICEVFFDCDSVATNGRCIFFIFEWLADRIEIEFMWYPQKYSKYFRRFMHFVFAWPQPSGIVHSDILFSYFVSFQISAHSNFLTTTRKSNWNGYFLYRVCNWLLAFI